jgi:hypothetical protein
MSSKGGSSRASEAMPSSRREQSSQFFAAGFLNDCSKIAFVKVGVAQRVARCEIVDEVIQITAFH